MPCMQLNGCVAWWQEVIIDVAPKKANWDLKRDVAKKLEKLERRTQRALMELMQEEEKRRFQEEGGVADEEETIAMEK